MATTRRSAPKKTAAPNRLERAVNPAKRGPIVLAADGTSLSGAPVLAARLLAAQLDLCLEVVSVLEPIPVYAESAAPRDVSRSAFEDSRREARETVVQDYVARFSGGATPPRVRVRVGSVAQEIARAARDLSATMIVVGAGPRERMRRIVSGELAAHLLRSADCPVLSVPPGFTALPKSVVVGVDFGPSSVRAAQAALLLLAGGGTLTITHVLPVIGNVGILRDTDEPDPASGVQTMFERLRDELAPYLPDGVTIETRLITDYAIDGLLKSVPAVGADLIAVGTHGPKLFERLLVGSVASSVLHSAERPVLAAPPPPPAEALSLWLRVSGSATSRQPTEWGAALDAFTQRNAGRGVILEIDDPDSGARVASHGYSLVGVTYDPGDRRIEIMMGDAKNPVHHLTRSVAHPESITMTAADGWRDEVLDVRHGRGHTLVMLESGTVATAVRS